MNAKKKADNKTSTAPTKSVATDGCKTTSLRYRNSLDDSVNRKIPWVIEGLLAEGEQMLMFGAPKVGKSQFAMQMAVSLALDKPFHAWPPGREGEKVLYVNLEIGGQAFMRRLADHVLSESEDNYSPDPSAPIPKEQMARVNELISNRFYFTEEITHVGISHLHIQGIMNGKTEPDDECKVMLRDWHGLMDLVQPDLVVFDTLSKVHNVDERENSAIQGVLMLLRLFATVRAEAEGQPRRKVAHVVVHHARKQSENGNGYYSSGMSLDSIRGGSSIRAEADVILGLQGKQQPESSQDPVARSVTLEARNIAGGEFAFQFNGFRFAAQTAEHKANANVAYKKRILQVFLAHNARGLAVNKLIEPLANPPGERGTKDRKHQERSKTYQEHVKRVNELVENGDPDFCVLQKREYKALPEKWPVFPANSNTAKFYWIRDGSPWLKELKDRGVAAVDCPEPH